MTSEPFARPLSELIHQAWGEESGFWQLSDEEKQDWLSQWETLAIKLECQAGDLRARIETLPTFEWGFSDSISKQAVLKLLDQAATPSDDALLKGPEEHQRPIPTCDVCTRKATHATRNWDYTISEQPFFFRCRRHKFGDKPIIERTITIAKWAKLTAKADIEALSKRESR